MIDKTTIIRLHEANVSNRQIAKQLSMSRTTIDKYVQQYKRDKEKLSEEQDPVEVAKLQQTMFSRNEMEITGRTPKKFHGELADTFYELIRLNDERNLKLGPNKQAINGAIIHRELVRRGFNIGESTIRARWRAYKMVSHEVFIKQCYEYGDRAEFDFHQVKVLIAGKVKIFHQATISCPASNFIFIRLMDSQSTKSVLTALIDFFRYAGGVFKEIVFDNMKPVVKSYGYQNNKALTDEIIKFAAYYGFKINTTNARKGNEKGHVENSGKVIRSELFSFEYDFPSVEAMHAYVRDQLAVVNQKAAAAFATEQQALKALPIHDYTIGEFGVAQVNSYSLAMVNTNYYSIPEGYVFREVRFTIINDLVVFYDKNHEIARHKLVEGKGLYQIEIKHYLKTLYRKPGAVARSLALKQADAKVIALYQTKYNNNPRGFIQYLYENEINDESGLIVETAAMTQLQQINQTFNL